MTVVTYRSERPGPWLVKKLGLVNIHDEWKCFGESCVIHNPSAHHMLWWTPVFDSHTGLVSRLCPSHQVAHPDPDSLAWLAQHNPYTRHVCKCRCCHG
jgi:hypothetical protein